MSFYRISTLFLGLIFGLFTLYFSSKNNFLFKDNSESQKTIYNDLDHLNIKSNKKQNFIFKSKTFERITETDRQNDKTTEILALGQKKQKNFDPKKEIKFEVIEGFAIAAGDIILGQLKDRLKNQQQSSGQTFITEEVQLWPNAEIPFAFDTKLSDVLKQRVLQSLDAFSKKTSVQFYPYDGIQKDFIVFSPSETLCASYVGRVGGAQPIFLNPNCQASEIQHEVMHVMGFIHEHQRDIRNETLVVFEKNIIPEKLVNFEILPLPFQNIYKNISVDLDFDSIMIYPSNAFVKAHGTSSLRIKDKDLEISNNTQISLGDIEKINNLYFRKF